jgi:hypothetical protein
MLLWPPTGPVVFGPNPVEGLNISEEQGRLRLRLRVVGPVDGDIMVFGATPCSTGRKKWRNGAFLGLLPAPVGGESDITELYVARHGEPEPGKRVFIRTRQQREGWKDHSRNVHEVVLAKAGAAGVEIRNPRSEGGLGRVGGRDAMHKGAIPYIHRSITGAVPSEHGWGMGSEKCGVRNGGLAEARRSGHQRELWRGT